MTTDSNRRDLKYKEIYRKANAPPEKRLKIFIPDVDDTWAIDIAYMNYKPELNDNYRYVFVCIDAFSRKCWGIPMKVGELNAQETLAALIQVMTDAGSKPKKIWSDRDKLFYNKLWEEYLTSKNITLYSTDSEHKSVYVERLQRTLKEMTEKLVYLNKTKGRWINVINEVFDTYNNKVHGSTLQTPNQLYNSEKLQNQRKTQLKKEMKVYKKEPIGKPKFKIGDIVRVSIVKGALEKSHTARWSKEQYEVNTVLMTNPITYQLNDAVNKDFIKGRFYENELELSKVPVKEKKQVHQEVHKVDVIEPEKVTKKPAKAPPKPKVVKATPVKKTAAPAAVTSTRSGRQVKKHDYSKLKK